MSDRRLHPAAAVTGALGGLRDMLVPIVLGGVIGGEFLVLAGLGVVAALVVGVVGWQHESYWVDEQGVHHRQGVLRKQSATIPLDRVQGLDTVRGPVQRLFGVVGLNVQAAGGGRTAEVALSAVSPAAADELRAALRLPPAAEQGPLPQRRLGPGLLVVAALTSGRLGVLVPLVAGASQLADDVVGDERAAALVPGSLGEALVLAAALLVVAWVLSIAGAIVAFAGFTVVRDGDRLRVRRGLLQRREASLPVARVQAVRIVESPLRQPFGLAEVRLESAGYATEERAARTLFPLLPRRAVPGLLAELLPEHAPPAGPLAPAPGRARRRYALPPLAAAAAVALAAVAALGPPGAAALALLPVAAVHGRARFRAAGVRLDGERLVLRTRRVARSTLVADARRLQSIARTQTVFGRRARLATLGVAVGSGTTVAVAHLERAEVDALLGRLVRSAAGGQPSPAA